MKYHLISGLLLIGAFAAETIGFSIGGAVLLGMGVACETWFWMRVVRGRSSSRTTSPV
jgi:hypothetical protein